MSGLGNIVGLNNFVPSMALATAGGGLGLGDGVASAASDDPIDMTSPMAFAADGDAFEAGDPGTVAVVNRPANNTSLASLFAPCAHHAMVRNDSAIEINVSRLQEPQKPKRKGKDRLWHFYPGKAVGEYVYRNDEIGPVDWLVPVDMNGTGLALTTMWVVGAAGMVAIAAFATSGIELIFYEAGAWLFNKTCGNAVAHGREWMKIARHTLTQGTFGQENSSIKDVLAQPIAKQAIGSEISQTEYRSALFANVREWNKLNPVEQAAFLRADRRSGFDYRKEPIVLQSRGTPVSVGFNLQRLLERFHGLGGVGAQQEMEGASQELSKWHRDYRAKLENGGEDTTKFRTDKSHIPAMAIGAKLAAIPAARRALRGVPRKQYEGMVKAVIKEWKTLNPVQRGTLHIADRLMGIATEEHGIDISPSWWTISTGFALMRMIGRLGLADVVAEGASKGPGVWYQRYSAYLAEASTHPLDLSVKKGMDSKSVISAHLLQIPEVRSALLNLSMKEYRAVIDRITSEWRKTNEVSQIDHLETDKKNGLLSDIQGAGLISPGFIARRFCERYLGMGEKAVRERFKLDAKVREKLEAWYRSYLDALDGVSV